MRAGSLMLFTHMLKHVSPRFNFFKKQICVIHWSNPNVYACLPLFLTSCSDINTFYYVFFLICFCSGPEFLNFCPWHKSLCYCSILFQERNFLKCALEKTSPYFKSLFIVRYQPYWVLMILPIIDWQSQML